MSRPFRRCIFLALAFALIISACDSSGARSEETDTPAEPSDGVVSFALERSENSNLPDSANSGFIRLWNVASDFNRVRMFEIPDAGETQRIELEAPAGGGYRVGIAATDSGTSGRSFPAVAAGLSDQFEVIEGEAKSVPLDLESWSISVTFPSAFVSDRKDTIRAVVSGPMEVTSQTSIIAVFLLSSEEYLGRLDPSEFSETDTAQFTSFEYTPPNLTTRDTLAFLLSTSTIMREGWEVDRQSPGSVQYTPPGSRFDIPLVPQSEDSGDNTGTIIVTFTSDGAVTRRVVE